MPLCVVELDSPVKAVAFSPEGRFLYTSNGNGSCYQVDLADWLSAEEHDFEENIDLTDPFSRPGV